MARKKDVSQVVSGAGLLTRIFTDLDKAVRAQGATDEDWHRLTTPAGERTIQAMADAFMEGRGTVRTGKTYRLTVDYDRGLADMVKAGHYDYVNDYITADNFPTEGSDTVEVEAVLVHPDRLVTIKEVKAELERSGFRPVTLAELLAFGEKHPDVQREFPVVALGSSWVHPDGDRRVPSLWGGVDGRNLGLYWDDPAYQWGSRCRFLAVRK